MAVVTGLLLEEVVIRLVPCGKDVVEIADVTANAELLIELIGTPTMADDTGGTDDGIGGTKYCG